MFQFCYFIHIIIGGHVITKVKVYSRTIGGKAKYGIRYTLNGKDRKEIIGTSKRQAELAANAKMKELFNQKRGLVSDRKINLEDLYQEYITRKRVLTESSKGRYRNLFRSFHQFMKTNFLLACDDIQNIARHHIEEYAEHLQNVEKKAPKTINGSIEHVHSVFLYAVQQNYIIQAPTRDVEKFPIHDEKEAPYFTPDELNRIWEVVDSYWLPFLQFLYYTGLRKGELINLTWKQVDLVSEVKRITIIPTDDYRTKTGGKRTIPLHEKAVQILQAQKGKDDKYVFVSREGKKIHPDKPYHSMKTALRKCNLEGDVHKLRHTFASHLVINGEDIYTVKELLGHKDITHTMIYSHLSPNKKQSAVDKLQKFNY